jgi:acyl carrier protein
MYQSGDLARWQKDGNIEFLGRSDYQVKIRGYRIEPREIESRLLSHDDIKDAVVIAQDKETKSNYYIQNQEKETFLCAYIVSRNQLDTSGLVEYLSGTLPGYMIPSYFVFLDNIPLTPNGKVHRQALPFPERKKEAEYIAPVTTTEKKLAKIWSEVLDVDEDVIGINTNFFQLGGHSLKAMKLAAQIYKEFNQKIPLTKIFSDPTIKKLVLFINNAEENLFMPIESGEKREYYSISAAQQRLYNLYRLSPQSTAFNVSIIRVIAGNLNRKRLERTFKQLIQRHESLRTCFYEINNELVQRVYPLLEMEVYYDDLHMTNREEKDILQNFKMPFVLEKAPLVRLGLIKSSHSAHILMLVMHHIITDGLSMEIFIKEAAELYNGRKPEPLKLQYRDFSYWQNKTRETGMFKKQEKYWLQQYADGLPELNLPFDYKRPPVQTFEGERFAFDIDVGQTEALKKLGLEEDATPAMVLAAVYYVLLSKLSGQEDIVVGQYISGRSHIDLENIIGLFINALAIRCYPSVDKPFRLFLREVKTKTLESFENQDLPLNDLMDIILTKKNVKQNLLFNASFIFQNQGQRNSKMEGLRIRPYKNDSKNYATKVDLLFDGIERGKKIIFMVEYSSQLFRRQTINYFVKCFKTILAIVLQNPDKKLSNITLSPGDKSKSLLAAFRDDLENESFRE